MAIPVKADHDLSAISDLAASVMVKLTVLRHCRAAGRRDIEGLRDVLQDYCDRVMETAHSFEPVTEKERR